jgi:hypothetical protein
MTDIIVIQPITPSLTVTPTTNSVVVSSVGVTGPKGDTGNTGATGSSGVVTVNAPITNAGTSTAANLSVSAGTTTDAGILQLTDSVSSTSTTTAATPNSVKTAYDLGNSAVTYGNLAKVLQNSTSVVDVLPRFVTYTNLGQSSGFAYFMFFTAPQSVSVTQISMQSGTTPSASLTLARMGLYTVDSSDNTTLVARTANDTTLFNASNAINTRSFDTTGGYPSSYSLVAGTRYALALIQVGTTPASVFGINASQNLILSLAPRMSGNASGLSDLPTSRTSYTNFSAQYWGRFS